MEQLQKLESLPERALAIFGASLSKEDKQALSDACDLLSKVGKYPNAVVYPSSSDNWLLYTDGNCGEVVGWFTTKEDADVALLLFSGKVSKE